jgi:hypothetical protein
LRAKKIVSENTQVTATIRMIGQEMDTNEVPVHLLVRTLESLQQIVYLLATFQEKQNIPKRFRIKDELKQLYTIRCQIPQAGSYAIPISFKPSFNSQLTTFTNYQELLDKITNLFRELCQDDVTNINNILPDSNLRNRVLRELKKLTPQVGENWSLGFSAREREEIIITSASNDYLNNWLNIDTPEDEVMTVTGELISIDFDRYNIKIKYPPTHQEIDCIYLEELEDDLIENRRQLIQVSGKFTLDTEGHPIKLTDVTKIEAVDLSSILLTEVSYQETKLRFKQSLRLTPTMDEESSQLFVVEDNNINLHVFAYTRDDLIHEINEQIVMMWKSYVKRDVNRLAQDARELREILLNTLEEID